MADEGSRQRTAASSITSRSQTVLKTKQKLLTNQLRKKSTAIEKEQETRKRELVKRKVNLKCQISDLKAERARAALKAMEEKERKASSARKVSTMTLPAVATAPAPNSLQRSKSEINLPMRSTATRESSTSTTLPSLTQATSMVSLPMKEKSEDKQDHTVDSSSWENFYCNYLRMPQRLSAPVYSSLPDVATVDTGSHTCRRTSSDHEEQDRRYGEKQKT